MDTLIAIILEDRIIYDRMRMRFARMPMALVSHFALFPSLSAFYERERNDISFMAYQGGEVNPEKTGLPYVRIGVDGEAISSSISIDTTDKAIELEKGAEIGEMIVPIFQPVEAFLDSLLEISGKAKTETKVRLVRICYRQSDIRKGLFAGMEKIFCPGKAMIIDWMPVSLDESPFVKGDRLLAYQCLHENHTGIGNTELNRIGRFSVFRPLSNEFDFGLSEELLSPKFFRSCANAGFETIMSFEYIGMAPIWPTCTQDMEERIIVISSKDTVDMHTTIQYGMEEISEWIKNGS